MASTARRRWPERSDATSARPPEMIEGLRRAELDDDFVSPATAAASRSNPYDLLQDDDRTRLCRCLPHVLPFFPMIPDHVYFMHRVK